MQSSRRIRSSDRKRVDLKSETSSRAFDFASETTNGMDTIGDVAFAQDMDLSSPSPQRTALDRKSVV